MLTSAAHEHEDIQQKTTTEDKVIHHSVQEKDTFYKRKSTQHMNTDRIQKQEEEDGSKVNIQPDEEDTTSKDISAHQQFYEDILTPKSGDTN